MFHNLFDNNLHWWFSNGYVAQSARAIQEKMQLNTTNTSVYALFIYCNCLETSPGGGPAENGANAAHWDPLLQQVYNILYVLCIVIPYQ